MELPKREIKYLPVSSLKPAPKNPKRHPKNQIDMLIKAINRFGFTNPILIVKDNVIAAGHARLEAAKKIGMAEVPTIFIDIPLEEVPALLLSDNRLAELAETDELIIAEMLKDTLEIPDFDIEVTGYTLDDCNKYLNECSGEVVEDEFNPNDVGESRCKEGDLWALGSHRLLCADSCINESVIKLMNGKKADLVFTDPPYGIDVVNEDKVGISAKMGFGKVDTNGIVKAKKYKKVIGDDKPYDPSHLLKNAEKIILWGANCYVSRLPDNFHWIVWDKKAEKGADHNHFSDCELAWTNVPRKSVVVYRHLWSGLLREGNRDIELSERVHPTQKPVGLLGNILLDYSKEGDIIQDLFLGSGSTLIACDQLNRICYGIEQDSQYCSIIISRWEQFTGQTAVKLN
jgi:DNA modification methylase